MLKLKRPRKMGKTSKMSGTRISANFLTQFVYKGTTNLNVTPMAEARVKPRRNTLQIFLKHTV